MWCEFEANDPCPRDNVEQHLSAIGFTPVETRGTTLARYQRSRD
jgi:hypothetical protein